MSDNIRPGERPSQLVVDPETPLESGLTVFTCLTSLFLLALAVGWASSGFDRLQGGVVLLLACLAGLGGWLRYRLDDHFVFDFEARELTFVRKFFGRNRLCPIGNFDQFYRLAVRPEKRANKQGVWWEYGLALVLQDGRQFTLISPLEKDRGKAIVEAQSLAKVLNLDLVEGEPERVLAVTPEPLAIEYVEYQDDTLKWVLWLLGICLALPVLVAVLAAFLS
ncbi:MAG: hypothetical protein AB7S38_15335 [Vulcanimicrobiota bacterium]